MLINLLKKTTSIYLRSIRNIRASVQDVCVVHMEHILKIIAGLSCLRNWNHEGMSIS